MATVVRLETVVDLDVPDNGIVGAGRVADEPRMPAGEARPGLWPGPRPVRDPSRVSVSATLSAVLDDGRRLTLLDDRGWGSTGHWDTTTVEEIEDTARTVVGPDEPVEGQTYDEMAAAHYAYLVAILDRQGVISDTGTLRSIPHDVVLTERLRARVTRA